VLLSVLDNSWKISDFGLASEGTSRFAYTTKFSRGTECYRATELVRDHVGSVTQSSDVWALGCILYELLFKIKAFPSDYHVFDYIHSKLLPTIHLLSGSKRLLSYLRELIYRMLEINWWHRPSASDVLAALESVSDPAFMVLVCDPEPEVSGSESSRQVDDSGARFTTSLLANSPNHSQAQEGYDELMPLSFLKTSFQDEDERWETIHWTPCW